MNKRAITVIAVLIAAFIGLIIFSRSSSETQSNVPPSEHIVGKVDSPVKLVEYGDFQCPGCAQYETVMQQIREKYQDKTAFQFRHFPLTQLHPNTLAAHSSSEAAAKQDKFWEYHDLLYEKQNSWNTASPTDRTAIFDGYAEQLGLNMEQFKADKVSAEVRDVIQADIAAGKEAGVSGTPTFILNGRQLEDTTADVEYFSRLIDEELKKAGL